jgi:hypothetical protein
LINDAGFYGKIRNPPVDPFFAVFTGKLPMSELLLRYGAHVAFQVALAGDNPFFWPLKSRMPYFRTRPFKLLLPLPLPYYKRSRNYRQIIGQTTFYHHFYQPHEREFHLEGLQAPGTMFSEYLLNESTAGWKKIVLSSLNYGTDPDEIVCQIKATLEFWSGRPLDEEVAYLLDYLGLPSGKQYGPKFFDWPTWTSTLRQNDA